MENFGVFLGVRAARVTRGPGDPALQAGIIGFCNLALGDSGSYHVSEHLSLIQVTQVRQSLTGKAAGQIL